MKNMHSSINPAISLFISQIRKLSIQDREYRILYELKKLAEDTTNEEESLLLKIYKKLYLLNIGINIDMIDFVKAIASTHIEIKKLGYLGLSMQNAEKYVFLLHNILQKDLGNEIYANDALGFIANLSSNDDIIKDLILKFQVPGENSRIYLKYLITRSKYDNTIFFPLISNHELNLNVKIQIILKKRLESKIVDNDIKWLIQKLETANCPFLRLNILTIFNRLFALCKLPINDRLIQFLKSFLVHSNAKSKKQIEIALAIEAMKLLIAIGQVSDKIEEFIFRLINSQNINSRFLGFRYATVFKILPEIAISKIFELGIDRKMYFDSLINLIDKSNFKAIYQRLNEIKQINASGRLEIIKREELITILLEKLCEFGDQEFICKVIFENGEFYNKIRHRGLVAKEQCKEFFKMVVQSKLLDHFVIIYDLFPGKSKSKEMVAELGSNHLKQLIQSKCEVRKRVLSNLIDFLCTHGDPRLNREYLTRDLIKEKTRDNNIDDVFTEIEAFNMVLRDKLIYVGDNEFISFYIKDNQINFTYPIDTDIIIDKIGEKIEPEIVNDHKTMTYSLKNESSIEITIKNRSTAIHRKIPI